MLGLLANSSGVAVNSAGHILPAIRAAARSTDWRTIEPDPLPEIVSPVVADAVSSPTTRHTSDFQVTPNGEFAVFPSVLPLSGVETGGRSEIYHYDALGQQLLCISCDPTGLKAIGDSNLAPNGLSLTTDGRVFFTSAEPLVARDGDKRKDAYEWKPEGTQGTAAARIWKDSSN